jgi:hypothetical protein
MASFEGILFCGSPPGKDEIYREEGGTYAYLK